MSQARSPAGQGLQAILDLDALLRHETFRRLERVAEKWEVRLIVLNSQGRAVVCDMTRDTLPEAVDAAWRRICDRADGGIDDRK